MRYLDRKRFSLKQIVVMLATTFIGIAAIGYASSLTIPYTFTSGTTISASQMNANFQAVKTAVDDNNTRINNLVAVRTGYVSVSALTGVLLDPTKQIMYIQQPAPSGPQGFYAVSPGMVFLNVPVQLPHGATITAFTYVAYDNDPTYDSPAWLEAVGNNEMVTLLGITTNGASTTVKIVTATSSGISVNNNVYAYFVRMRMDGGTNGNNTNVVAIKAIIRYEYSL